MEVFKLIDKLTGRVYTIVWNKAAESRQDALKDAMAHVGRRIGNPHHLAEYRG